MDLATVTGALATLCSTTSFLPQVVKIVRTGETDAISLRMYAVTVTGFALWLVYGALLASWPLMIANGLCLALSAFILWMKLLPDPWRRRLARRFASRRA